MALKIILLKHDFQLNNNKIMNSTHMARVHKTNLDSFITTRTISSTWNYILHDDNIMIQQRSHTFLCVYDYDYRCVCVNFVFILDKIVEWQIKIKTNKIYFSTSKKVIGMNLTQFIWLNYINLDRWIDKLMAQSC